MATKKIVMRFFVSSFVILLLIGNTTFLVSAPVWHRAQLGAEGVAELCASAILYLLIGGVAIAGWETAAILGDSDGR